MREINSAILQENDKPIVQLNHPKLRIEDGIIYVDCFIEKDFFGKDYRQSIVNSKSYFDDKTYSINAFTSSGSLIVFNKVAMQSESYPSFKFSFLCYDYNTECINAKNEKNISLSNITYFIAEGIEVLFTKSSETKRNRMMFGKDESRILSFELDHSEIHFNYFDKKRNFNLDIGLIKNVENDKSVLVKFFQKQPISYRFYQEIKHSLKYFISYLSGNNIVIREEYYQHKLEHFTRTYSQNELSDYNVNHFLPIHKVQFKHKRIINDYVDTFSNYLIWDRTLNLSEVIYLINQSKQVNIESSFFILLIVIEKIANSLYVSGLIDKKKNSILNKEEFSELKSEITQLIDQKVRGKIAKKQLELLKSKVGNINNLSKTENKIDLLLEFCEIKRNDDIDQLFPKLRNLAIHQGEISYERKDSSKNYHTLYILINSIICNLIQYKGLRFIEHKNGTNYISKKEEYKLNIEKTVANTVLCR
ncbi:hypothetical protein [Algibacter sp. PT7-4]|uniref:hypothetical protein n=1 Tax=Algibacter ulvanivorans TaxID=3400999 RepID=UPI003AAB31AA